MAVSFESLQDHLLLSLDWTLLLFFFAFFIAFSVLVYVTFETVALDLLSMCGLILFIVRFLKSTDSLDELNLLRCLIISLVFRSLVEMILEMYRNNQNATLENSTDYTVIVVVEASARRWRDCEVCN